MVTLLLLYAIAGVPVRTDFHRHIPSLEGATAWINTQPLTPAELQGKVVLVEFWTYTCINWRRTLPYVRTWAERYKAAGLVVIGISTPEFSFEHDIDNVRQAVRDMGIEFPIALDNNYAVWRAFDNEYWPALYLIDAQGHIRYHRFGEGDYDQTEMVIQQLLKEAGVENVPRGISPVDPQGVEIAADWKTLRSGETYVGYGRAEGFSSPGGVVDDKPHPYLAPSRLDLNQWALSGSWTLGKEAAFLQTAGGRVVFRFHARDVNLILGPARRGVPLRFRVAIDGQAPGAAHGIDVDDQGNGVIDGERMYQLVRQHGVVTDRDISIEFLDPGAEVFDFTFG